VLIGLSLSGKKSDVKKGPAKFDEGATRLELMNELKPSIMKARTTPITFYGKVLDQNDTPVAYTEISGGMKTFFPNPAVFFMGVSRYKTKTDKNGNFTVKGKGKSISVSGLKCRGYEMIYDDAIRSYDYALEPSDNPKMYPIHHPDPEKPVVFRMRKKEKAEVLISLRTDGWFKTNGEKYYCNIYSGEIGNKNIFWDNDKKRAFNLEFQVFMKKGPNDSDLVTLIIRAATGIAFQEYTGKEKYVAPEKGYHEKELVLNFKRTYAMITTSYMCGNVEKKEQVKKYKMELMDKKGKYVNTKDFDKNLDRKTVYDDEVLLKLFIKNKAMGIYSKMNMIITPFVRVDEFRVIMRIVTNPNGNRGVDVDKYTQNNTKDSEIRKLQKKLGVRFQEDIKEGDQF
jgi:hypothetical protein